MRYPADPSLSAGSRRAGDPCQDVDAPCSVAREAFPAWRDRLSAERADDPAPRRRPHGGAPLRSGGVDGLRERQALARGRRRRRRGDRLPALLRPQAERLLQPVPMDDVLGEDNDYFREPAASRRHRAVELPARDHHRHEQRRARDRQQRHPQAGGAVAAHRRQAGGVLREAGVPRGGRAVSARARRRGRWALVEHPDVATIAFTGSRGRPGHHARRGRGRPGQRSVKRVIAEMGGKNAIIVDDDADLDQAVAGVVTSAFGYAGQKCSACSRLIVVGSAYDEAIARLAPAVESLVVGPPHEPATFVPPVISEQARQRSRAYIEAGKQKARLLVQGRRPPGDGYFVRADRLRRRRA